MTATSTSHETRPPTALRLTDRALDDRVRLVHIAGDVDLASAPALKTALGHVLDEHPGCDLVVDLEEVTHLDSTGLAVLIGVRRRLSSGQKLVIAAAPGHVQHVLELTGLDGVFDTVSTVGEAEAYLAATRSSDQPVLSPDAALVLGLATTALSFAPTVAAEAECWTRILLPYASLPLEAQHSTASRPCADPSSDREPGACGDHVARLDRVIALSARLASARGAGPVRTGDVLRAVTDVYGLAF